MDAADLDLKENLIVRVKSLKNGSERLIRLRDRLDALDIEFMLNNFAISNSRGSRVFLSRCVSDGNFYDWGSIDRASVDCFSSWFLNPNSDDPFELVFPLHLSRKFGGHWGVGRIVSKKNGNGLEFIAEFYNPSGNVKHEFEKAKKVLDHIIEDLTNSGIVYTVAYQNKFNERIQESDTMSCGFYAVEIERRLASGLPMTDLTRGSLDSNVAKIKLIKSLGIGTVKLDNFEKSENFFEQRSPTQSVNDFLHMAERENSANGSQMSSSLSRSPHQNITGAAADMNDEAPQEVSANLVSDSIDGSLTTQNISTDDTSEISKIQSKIRKLVVINYLKSVSNIDDYSGEDGELDETKLSDSLRMFCNYGEISNNFELKNKILQYVPKDILNPPIKNNGNGFIVKAREADGYLIFKGEYPFENSGRIKIPDNQTAIDVILRIRFNGLDQYKNVLEFGAVNNKIHVGELEFSRRMTAFNALRQKSRGNTQ